MSKYPVDDVKRLAVESGISGDLFADWDGGELALYRLTGGVSASPEVAARIARENAASGGWVLDIGNRAAGLSGEQGMTLQQKLDAAGIPYETGSQDVPYLKRTQWALEEHKDVLDELAKK